MKTIQPTLLIGIIFTAVLSCTDQDTATVTMIKPGTYKGQFIRFNSNMNSPNYNVFANVTLHFDGNQFSGTSEKTLYPAICKGRFSLTGQEIYFENLCAATLNFDWSLMLNGKYQVKMTGNTLSIRRQTGENLDSYSLVLQ